MAVPLSAPIRTPGQPTLIGAPGRPVPPAIPPIQWVAAAPLVRWGGPGERGALLHYVYTFVKRSCEFLLTVLLFPI